MLTKRLVPADADKKEDGNNRRDLAHEAKEHSRSFNVKRLLSQQTTLKSLLLRKAQDGVELFL